MLINATVTKLDDLGPGGHGRRPGRPARQPRPVDRAGLRGPPRTARRPRGRRPRLPAAGQPAQSGQAALPGRRRGHRLPHPPGPGPLRHRLPGRRRLGRPRPQPDRSPGRPACGKSYLACALANAAMRRPHRLLPPTPTPARGTGHRPSRRPLRPPARQLAKVSLLVLDDFLLTPAPVEACRDLLEVIEDRAARRSTLVASQLPVDNWHAAMADPTLAEAILDRALQPLHRIAMKGPSLRRRQPDLNDEE